MTTELNNTLEYIRLIKEDIKAAIISRGGNVDGMPFTYWPRCIARLSFGAASVVPSIEPPIRPQSPRG